MSKTDSKHIKIETESANGTMVNSDMWLIDGMYEVTYAYCCKRCLTPFPEYKFLKSFRLYWWKKLHKCEKSTVLGIENVKVRIEKIEDDTTTY